MKQNEMNSQKAQELTKEEFFRELTEDRSRKFIKGARALTMEELVTVQFATNINNVLIYNKKMRNCFNTFPHFYIPL